MSTESQANARHVSTPPRDRLAALDDDEVLRCEHNATEWIWYYDVTAGHVRKFHEFHDFAPESVSWTEALETVGCEDVSARPVGRRQLEVLRGEGDE